MYRLRGIPRLRGSSSSILSNLSAAQLRRKALNSFSAAQDTFYTTKDLFERHRVVFTICTSIASVATAWAGYTLRHLHQSRIDQRLESIEKAMKSNHPLEDREIKKLVRGTVTLPACVATAGTSLIIGYMLGWRCGAWYTNRKFRREQMKLLGPIKPKGWPLREQMKLLGQIRPKGWPLKFLRRPPPRSQLQETAAKITGRKQKDASVAVSETNTKVTEI